MNGQTDSVEGQRRERIRNMSLIVSQRVLRFEKPGRLLFTRGVVVATIKAKRPVRLRRDARKVTVEPLLEDELQGVLNLAESVFTDVLRPAVVAARSRSGRENLGCAGQRHNRTACIGEHRRIEVDRGVVNDVVSHILRVVEQIEELHSELQSKALREFEV